MNPERTALKRHATTRMSGVFSKRNIRPVRARVETHTRASVTGSEGRTKRCLYLFDNCSVDDPYS